MMARMLVPFLVRRHGQAVRTMSASWSIIVLLLVLGEGRASAQSQGPLTIETGGTEATILADQILQLGGSNDLMIAIGNVEITEGRTRLLADRVEVNRDGGG